MTKLLCFFVKNKTLTAIAFTACAFLLFYFYPTIAQSVYRNGFYQLLRIVFDFGFTWIPIPLIHLLLLAIAVWMARYFYRNRIGFKQHIVHGIRTMGMLVVLFFVLWGFNYQCPSTHPIDSSYTLSNQQLYDLGYQTAQWMNLHRPLTHNLEEPSTYPPDDIRQLVESYCQSRQIPTYGRVQCKEIHLRGWMRKWGIAGIYFPFTAEAYCDATFPEIVKPFIKAHEMAHGYGITHEGEADFFAYQSLLMPSSSDELKYVAKLELLRSIRSELYTHSSSLLDSLNKHLSGAVLQDLKSIRENALRYPEFIPGMQSALNDKYLKSLGIQEGVASYNYFIYLVWKQESSNTSY